MYNVYKGQDFYKSFATFQDAEDYIFGKGNFTASGTNDHMVYHSEIDESPVYQIIKQ